MKCCTFFGHHDCPNSIKPHLLEAIKAVLDAFKGHYLMPMVYLTLYYGLRRSELLGLRWDAIDFVKNTITIQHTVVKSRTVVARDETKTENSRATMEMLPDVRDMLLSINARERENRAYYGDAYSNNEYVFKHDNGQLYYPDTITKTFQKILARNNLPEMRFHDLRKSTASWLFNMGWDINSVREWLRHADIETTANIYTEISRDKIKSLGNSITNTFKI